MTADPAAEIGALRDLIRTQNASWPHLIEPWLRDDVRVGTVQRRHYEHGGLWFDKGDRILVRPTEDLWPEGFWTAYSARMMVAVPLRSEKVAVDPPPSESEQ